MSPRFFLFPFFFCVRYIRISILCVCVWYTPTRGLDSLGFEKKTSKSAFELFLFPPFRVGKISLYLYVWCTCHGKNTHTLIANEKSCFQYAIACGKKTRSAKTIINWRWVDYSLPHLIVIGERASWKYIVRCGNIFIVALVSNVCIYTVPRVYRSQLLFRYPLTRRLLSIDLYTSRLYKIPRPCEIDARVRLRAWSTLPATGRIDLLIVQSLVSFLWKMRKITLIMQWRIFVARNKGDIRSGSI